MSSLAGKIALVTGGSSGVGHAAARVYARAGAVVVIAARGEERGKSAAAGLCAEGGDATFVRADVGILEDVEGLFDHIRALHGRLDVAFNGAAVDKGAFMRTADFSLEEFEEVMRVNVRGLWLCMKHEIRMMLAKVPPGGTIVNASSVNGLGGAREGSLYSASKAAVHALTKSAAQEYAQQGVRVNAVVLGPIKTPMLDRVLDRASGGDQSGREELVRAYTGHVPLGRLGHPEEAAEAIAWLSSDAASFVNGHTMIVDGGMSAGYR